MPKDEWRRARDQTVARKVKHELATGKPLSFEFVAEEITPLDKINIFTSAPPAIESVPAPAQSEAPPKPPTRPPSRSGFLSSIRYIVAAGVTVKVTIDRRRNMDVVQALEAALAAASAPSSGKGGLKSERAKPDTVKEKPPQSVVNEKQSSVSIATLRARLKTLAHLVATRNLLEASWMQKSFRSWLRRLEEIRTPSTFASHMAKIELYIPDPKRNAATQTNRRSLWRNECSTATNLRRVAVLLDEFERWFS